MSASVTTYQPAAVLTTEHIDTITNLVLAGDLSKMNNQARVGYYVQLCQSLSLNPHTQPFQILKFQGKEIMYATKSCTEQLRKLWGVSVTKLESRQEGDVYIVVAYVIDSTGRTDAGTGAVPVTNLKGEALANAFMKAETKAKRRATLSICGLGMLDESELDTMPQATQVAMPPVADAGTSATVVPEPAAAEPTRVHVVGTVSTQAEIDERAINGHRTRFEQASTLKQVEQIWTKLPKHLAPKLVADKDAAKKRLDKPAAVTSVATQNLAQEFVDQSTKDGAAPVEPASGRQKEQIIGLLNHPLITQPEKTKVLLNLNRLDTCRAAEAIKKLNRAIDDREGITPSEMDGLRRAAYRMGFDYAAPLGDSLSAELLRLSADDAVTAHELRELMADAKAVLTEAEQYAA